MENRALGKGLSALIPEKTQLDASETIAHIKTAQIKNNNMQPRTAFDKSALADLVASIKEKGVLQPILVRKKGAGYEVVAGERRLRAARQLGMPEVPAVIRDVDDKEALVIALVENIQREELNPVEEAHAFQRLIDEFNFTQDAVAQAVGKDRSTISNILRLLKLPKEIQKSIAEGLFSFGHARTLLAIESDGERMRLYLHVMKHDTSVRELEQLVKRGAVGKGKKKKMPDSRDPYVVAIEEDMQKILGTKVRITSQKKRGKIEIEFYSPTDLERICHILKK